MRYNRLLRGARSVEQIVAKLDPSRADILLSQLRPAILQPAYILIRDRVERRLFFVIRGTHSVRDTVTSLTAHPRPHHAIGADGVPVLGYAHAGFLSTARWLAKNTRDDLAAASASNPGFELTIVGHSLGAGTAVLLTQLLRELEGGDRARNPFADVECLAFACPSCLSKELSESCRPFITTVVSNADVVPLVSFSKVSELQAQIVSAAWEQQVLKKWRETTRAMSAACAAPREKRRSSPRATGTTGFPLLGRGLGGSRGRSRAVSAARRDASTMDDAVRARGVGGWRDGAPSGRRRRRARRSSSTVARRADAFAATRRGRRRRKQTRQVGEHKRRAHRGVRRSEKIGREVSRTRGRVPPRRVGRFPPRRVGRFPPRRVGVRVAFDRGDDLAAVRADRLRHRRRRSRGGDWSRRGGRRAVLVSRPRGGSRARSRRRRRRRRRDPVRARGRGGAGGAQTAGGTVRHPGGGGTTRTRTRTKKTRRGRSAGVGRSRASKTVGFRRGGRVRRG